MFRILIATALAALSLFALAARADYAGLAGSTGTPTVTGCGTGASLVSGSLDHVGTINVGTGLVTSCTLNFSGTLAGTSRCVVSAYGLATSPVLLTKVVTNAGISMTFLLTVAGASIDYTCYIN